MPTSYYYVEALPDTTRRRQFATLVPVTPINDTPIGRQATQYVYTDSTFVPARRSRFIPPNASVFVQRRPPPVEPEEEIPTAPRLRVVTPPVARPPQAYTLPHRTPMVIVYEDDDDVITIRRRVIPASRPPSTVGLLWRRRRWHVR